MTKEGTTPPLLVTAEVNGVSTDEVRVTVTRSTASDRELCVLQYWLIGTMEGTTVRKVRFEYPEGKPPEFWRYKTGGFKHPKRTFDFVIPEYEPSGTGGRWTDGSRHDGCPSRLGSRGTAARRSG